MNESELFNAEGELSSDKRTKFLELPFKGNPELRKQFETSLDKTGA